MPGGFQRLKQDFEKFLPTLEPQVKQVQDEQGRVRGRYARSEVLEFLCARALFEIAGNLDTIAAIARNLEERGQKRNS